VSESANSANLELSGERQVAFSDRGRPLVYTFRRITAEDWTRFFAGVTVESVRVGVQSTRYVNHQAPGVELVEKCLLKVRGYATREQRSTHEDISDPALFKALFFGHKVKAAELLQRVTVAAEPDNLPFVLDAETQEVVLDALWGIRRAEDPAPPTMTQFKGLVHRLKHPTAEHQRRFARAATESRVVGAGRTGKTVYPGQQSLLAQIYDELVASVEGYCVNGEPLTSPEAIRREMDMYHKVAAAQQLFASPDEETSVEEVKS
jgi:hypothetical protein